MTEGEIIKIQLRNINGTGENSSVPFGLSKKFELLPLSGELASVARLRGS